MSSLILPPHYNRQHRRKQMSLERLKEKRGDKEPENLHAQVHVTPSHIWKGKFAGVIVLEGFPSQRGAERMMKQIAAMVEKEFDPTTETDYNDENEPVSDDSSCKKAP